jgi:integrase
MPITIKLPKYVEEVTIRRDGQMWGYFYFRQKGGPRIRLPNHPWSPEFMAAYAEALKGLSVKPKGTHAIAAGSVEAALIRYYQSAMWTDDIGEESRKYRRPILEQFRDKYGAIKMRAIQRSHIQTVISLRKPAAQGNWMRSLRGFFKFAMSENIISVNPTADVIQSKRIKTDGFRPWTEGDVKAYRARYPLGTRERLAMEIMLNLGVRVSDARRIGPANIVGNVLTDFQPQKSARRGGFKINVPVNPELRRAIAAMKVTGTGSYLLTTEGNEYTAEYLSQKMRDWCRDAGLPDATASHGLRKLCLTRLAEIGCSVFEIMAISGHKQLSEVQRYTEAASRKKLSYHAVARQHGIVLKGTTVAELMDELDPMLTAQATALAVQEAAA